MSCKLEIKAVNRLKDQKLIDDKFNINDLHSFNIVNEQLTEVAVNTYGLDTKNRFLFDVREKHIKMPFGNSYHRDNTKTLFKAVANKELFKELEILVDNKEVAGVSNKPDITMEIPSLQDIVDSVNPIELKKQRDSIKDRYDNLNNLINCIWAS